MAGYNPQNLPRTKASASDFSDVSSFPSGNTGLSFRETVPTQGNHSGSIWHGTGEGQQYFYQDALSQGPSRNGISDSFNVFSAPQMFSSGQVIAHGPVPGTPGNQWIAKGEAMTRMPSQDSEGAHSIMSASTANSYDRIESTRAYPSLKSFHASSASTSGTGRSSPDQFAVYTPRQQQQSMDLPSFDQYPYPGGEDFSSTMSGYHGGDFKMDVSSNASLTSGSSYSMFPSSSEDGFVPLAAQTPVTRDALIYNNNMLSDSPPVWDNTAFPDSQTSSPMPLEDWSLPGHMASTSSSPLQYNSPSFAPISPVSPLFEQDLADITSLPPYTTGDRVVKKAVGPRPSKVASDMAARGHNVPGKFEDSDDTVRFAGRSSIDIDNTARDHKLYQNVVPQADGLYHCPWEGKEGCGHKPEKLKCNYDKFVDSHLKPYRCKINACGDSRFSSTACLLRHEREAHAMHGHGDKPYLCTYEGCERGAAGNGFPRQWNLRDHMRRMHNDDPGPIKTSPGNTPPPSAPPRGKNKRKADATESEKGTNRVTAPSIVIKQEASAVEHYHHNKRRLMEVVQQLNDPMNAQNMDLLRNANTYIKSMVHATQRINPATAMVRSSSQQSG